MRLGDFNSRNWQNCDYGAKACTCLHFEVIERIVHPDFKKVNALIDDIGLLKLNTEIPFTKQLRPICLPLDKIDLVNETVIACGWGSTMLPNNPIEKRAAALIVMRNENHEHCGHTTPGKHICAGGNGNNTCDGDSGGPLMRSVKQSNGYTMILEGIISQGFTDCRRQSSIFTPVHNYLEWINQYIN